MIRLKEVRKARGLTQAELATMVRHADPTADQAMISVLERGEIYPSEKLRDALCDALNCSEGDLYDGIEAFFVPSEEPTFSDSTEILSAVFDRLEGEGFKTVPRGLLRREIEDWYGDPISDRQMRKWIETARQEGMLICNNQDGEGYYRPQTEEEIRKQLIQTHNRAMSVLRQETHLRRRLKCRSK